MLSFFFFFYQGKSWFSSPEHVSDASEASAHLPAHLSVCLSFLTAFCEVLRWARTEGSPACLAQSRLFLALTLCPPSWRFAALTNVTDTQGWLLRHLALVELSGSMKSAFYLTFHFFSVSYLDANFNLTRHIKNPEKLFFPSCRFRQRQLSWFHKSILCFACCLLHWFKWWCGEEAHPQRAHFTSVSPNCVLRELPSVVKPYLTFVV